MNAIQIIQSEHRALAAVLHGLQYLVDEICLRGKPVDLRAVGAMIYYIDAFPERFHHPKEDRYLFPLLEARSPQCAAAIGALKAEHALGARKMRALEQAFTRYRDGGAAELPTFAAAVEAYCTFEREHISREEREILPLAKRVLTGDDWEEIDAAFTGHTDPLLGQDASLQWEDVLKRIVTLAPAPIGVGPSLESSP